MADRSNQKSIVVTSDSHRLAKIEAAKAGKTIGEWVTWLIAEYVKKGGK